MVEINRLSQYPPSERPCFVTQIKAVFFAAALKKDFSSVEEKEVFFRRWVSHYIDYCTDEVFLAEENGVFLGYLTGCRDSMAALPRLSSKIKSYPLFKDLFADYPAHLHINLAASARGRGVGGRLVEAYHVFLKENGVTGVHLITAPGARNVGFYLKNGFRFQVEREFNSIPLLFMGRKV